MDKQRVLQRFLRYVQIDTTAREGAESYPSSPGQLELGRLLLEELRQMGIGDAAQDEHGIVTATVPATVDRPVPVIAFCAHLDTSPETTGAGVKPQVIEKYEGGDVVLPGVSGRVIRADECPELDEVVGHTLVTTDGTTLLGADDKAGVAAIMVAAARMIEDPGIAHGPIRICFTCDEEIGRGVDYIDLAALGATACYTLDGQGADRIDVETFSADKAVVTVRGVEIHPSIARDRMVNAVRVAADFISRLPRDRLAPEVTDGRDGFVHPYQIGGGVGEVTLSVLLRDFEAAKLADQAELLAEAGRQTAEAFPGASLEVEIIRQYRNLAEGLSREPRAVEFAARALERLGRTARREIIRGGTDGARLTEMGLPTPNLSCGQHTPHSPLEWASADEMARAVEWIVAIARQWASE